MGRPRKQEIELTGTERASLSDPGAVAERTAGPGAPSAHRAGLGGGHLKYRDRA